MNSAAEWVRFELRRGRIPVLPSLMAAGWMAAYRFGFARIEQAIRRSLATQKGIAESEFERRILEFYEEKIHGSYRPGAAPVLEEHRKRGDRLVLLTTTGAYLAKPVCSELSLDGWLANRFEVDQDGYFSGKFIEPICYGPGKVELARTFLRDSDESLSDCAFYSDSFSDLPMLRAVGRPVVVNPDQRLHRVARRNGWQVVDWGA